MVEDPNEVDRVSHYALRPATPTRAWVLAVLCLGLGGLAVWQGLGEPRRLEFIIPGVVAVLGALVLAVVAITFVNASTTHVELSDEGFEVTGPGYHKAGNWLDVSAVAATPDGARLVITQGHVDRTFIQAPGGAVDEQMRALTKEISELLETRALGRRKSAEPRAAR